MTAIKFKEEIELRIRLLWFVQINPNNPTISKVAFTEHNHYRFCIGDSIVHSRKLKTLLQKFGIQGFHNEIMTLIFFKYKVTYVTWLPFVSSFSQHLLRLVCDVTCCVIFIMRFWLLLHNFRAKVLMKSNAPAVLLSK